jgi:hypothetical protein
MALYSPNVGRLLFVQTFEGKPSPVQDTYEFRLEGPTWELFSASATIVRGSVGLWPSQLHVSTATGQASTTAPSALSRKRCSPREPPAGISGSQIGLSANVSIGIGLGIAVAEQLIQESPQISYKIELIII